MSNRNETDESAPNLERVEFQKLVRTYSRTVFNLAYAIVGDRGAAEEVSQDVFFRVWQHLRNFKGQSAFPTWLYAITRNTAISYRRKLLSRGASKTSAYDQIPEEYLPVDVQSTTDFLEERLLINLIAELPPDMQSVIRLFYLEEQSVDRVAQVLRIPNGTVKTLLHRARLRLQTRFEKYRMEKLK
jgi:RNA polymerase sigma-70 factor (ECF subfamily)